MAGVYFPTISLQCGQMTCFYQWNMSGSDIHQGRSSSESRSVMSDSLQLHGLCSWWNSPVQNTGVGSLFLLQGIFPTQDQTQVSHIAGRFFTSWATREVPFSTGFITPWNVLVYFLFTLPGRLLSCFCRVWLFVTLWNSPGKDTGEGCHALLQIFPTQGSNLCLLHLWLCRRVLYPDFPGGSNSEASAYSAGDLGREDL